MDNLNKLDLTVICQNFLSLDINFSYCLGLSGGIDSVVLLDILANLAKMHPLKLSAIHVNHGVSPNSEAWEKFCISLCNKYGLDLTVARLKITKKAGMGLENTLRKYRYLEYAKTNSDVIVLAHHLDDQIETMLSQVLRGSNIHNLAGMQEKATRKKQLYIRPLLKFTKTAIKAYATTHQLNHIEDESNLDTHYLRNFLRRQIIPQLIDYDSYAIPKLNQALSSIQESVSLNDEIGNLDLNLALIDSKLNLNYFKNLSNLRQINLLSYFIRSRNLALPSHKQLVEFTRQLLHVAQDKHPKLKLSVNYKIYLERGFIKISII